jgi:hypothetical protein
MTWLLVVVLRSEQRRNQLPSAAHLVTSFGVLTTFQTFRPSFAKWSGALSLSRVAISQLICDLFAGKLGPASAFPFTRDKRGIPPAILRKIFTDTFAGTSKHFPVSSPARKRRLLRGNRQRATAITAWPEACSYNVASPSNRDGAHARGSRKVAAKLGLLAR